MLFFHRKTKLITTDDSLKEDKIKDVLEKHHIPYFVKVKESYSKNPFDTAMTGTFGVNQIKLRYLFYVDKENAAYALHLIHSLIEL